MLEKVEQVHLGQDNLHRTFGKFADADTPSSAKLFTGTLSDFNGSYHGDTYDLANDKNGWTDLWNSLGVVTPPSAPAEPSVAELVIVGDDELDSRFELASATHTLTELQLEWNVVQTPAKNEKTKAGYAVVVMPRHEKMLAQHYNYLTP